jgi:hypothetical protein
LAWGAGTATSAGREAALAAGREAALGAGARAGAAAAAVAVAAVPARRDAPRDPPIHEGCVTFGFETGVLAGWDLAG